MNPDVVTISTNYWRVPSVQGAFSGWLEGKPTEEERQLVIEAAKVARAAWKPTPEAMALVEQMKRFIGSRVCLQFWDPCMWMLEEEGPFPVYVDCVGVVIMQDGDFPQAYLQVENMKEIPNADGYSPASYLQERANCNYLHAPLADLYTISKVVAS